MTDETQQRDCAAPAEAGGLVVRQYRQFTRAVGWALALIVSLSSGRAQAAESEDDALLVPGMLLTGLGAGALSAVVTPMVVGGVARMTGSDHVGPAVGQQKWSFPFGIGLASGLLALAAGIPLWAAATPDDPRYVDDHGFGRPAKTYHSPAMRKAGIVLVASGAGLGLVGVLVSYLPGDCNDSAPSDCTYPMRDAAIGMGLVGIVAAGTGVGLWITGGRKVRAPGAPTVSLVATGQGLGVRGAF